MASENSSANELKTLHYSDKLSFSNYLSLDILYGAYSFGDSIFFYWSCL